MAYDAKYLRVPEIRWLGVFPSDSEKYCLPERCLLPMTAEGKLLYVALPLLYAICNNVPCIAVRQKKNRSHIT